MNAKSEARVGGRRLPLNAVALFVGLLCLVAAALHLRAALHTLVDRYRGQPLAGLLLVPESPRWMVQRNRHQEALEVLALIDGRQSAEAEMREILAVKQRLGFPDTRLNDAAIPAEGISAKLERLVEQVLARLEERY